MTIGQRLQQLRQTLALSQEEFGEALGVSRQTVSKWELDQTLPELAKIVMMSKLFSVTTDYILIDGITSFDAVTDPYPCGIYRSQLCEIAETEKYALEMYCNADKTKIGMKFFVGFRDKKLLRAVCERDTESEKTKYAYMTDENTVFKNDDSIAELLGTKYDPTVKAKIPRREEFRLCRSGTSLPTVSEVGILKALQSWRMCAKLTSNIDRFSFSLCTDKTEYIFSIEPNNHQNIYCGASFNRVFDLGLYCSGQYFRIRSYKDNSKPFCGFGCDFSYTPRTVSVPTDKCDFAKSSEHSNQTTFTVKRYDDNEIVLSGCGGDEYVYRRDDERNETYF